MSLRERARRLRRSLPAIMAAMTHRNTPWYEKALAGLTIGYALSPIDLIPDFIPVLGLADDLLILPALCALTIRLIPPDVLAACRQHEAQLSCRRWYYGVPIILLWALLAASLIHALVS